MPNAARRSPASSRARGNVVPLFRKPTPQDAFDLARATFVANERVDMQALTARLGVARTTLHRWVGTRESLLDRILGDLAGEFWDLARAEAEGQGEELVLDAVRRILGATARYEPARGFVQREPVLAMRLLAGEEFSVRGRSLQCLSALVAEALPGEAGRLGGFAEALVHVGSALEWSAIMAGDEPSPERLVEVARALLLAARSGALQADGPVDLRARRARG
jgi:AcrR family transcriptional regulator